MTMSNPRRGAGAAAVTITLSALMAACAGRAPAPAGTVAAPAGYVDPVTAMEFARVPGGTFEMGDVLGGGEAAEGPAHTVLVSDFYLGVTEVTQAQWEKVMGANPSRFRGPDRPVEQVSWNDAQAFVQKLNQLAHRTYRLPTEAEWEYAARSGGRLEKWAGTSDPSDVGSYAWVRDNSPRETQPVRQKKPNGLGLYDLSGNVWEWCQDRYDERYYGQGPGKDPPGPDQGNSRVLRGGSWDDPVQYARTTQRLASDPTWLREAQGFRLVLPAVP